MKINIRIYIMVVLSIITLCSCKREKYYYNRGNQKYDKFDLKGAILDYSKAIDITPRYADAYNKRGLVKYVNGDAKNAIKDINKAIEINANLAEAFRNRALIKKVLNDFQGALGDYTTAIQIEPKYSDAYFGRGLLKANFNDYPGALKDYDMAIKTNPKNDLAYNNRGVVKEIMGDFKGALNDYDAAVKINHSAIFYNNRARAKSHLGDLKGAITDYALCLAALPNYSKAYYSRAVAEYYSNNMDGALRDFTKVIELGDMGDRLSKKAAIWIWMIELHENRTDDIKWSSILMDIHDNNINEKKLLSYVSALGVQDKCELYYFVAKYYIFDNNAKKGMEYLNKCIVECPKYMDEYVGAKYELEKIKQ